MCCSVWTIDFIYVYGLYTALLDLKMCLKIVCANSRK